MLGFLINLCVRLAFAVAWLAIRGAIGLGMLLSRLLAPLLQSGWRAWRARRIRPPGTGTSDPAIPPVQPPAAATDFTPRPLRPRPRSRR